MKEDKTISYVILIAIIFALYKLFQKIGFIKTQSEEVASGLDLKDFTTKDYWKQRSGAKVFTISTTNQLIDKILDSHHWYNDDEEKMVSALKSVKYKTQYSWLVDKFQQRTGEDLTAWLRNYFSDKELETPFNYLTRLPSGF